MENLILIFCFVFRHGAEVVEKGASGSSKKSAVFKGTGYRLGQSDNDTQGNTNFFLLYCYEVTQVPTDNSFFFMSQ